MRPWTRGPMCSSPLKGPRFGHDKAKEYANQHEASSTMMQTTRHGTVETALVDATGNGPS